MVPVRGRKAHMMTFMAAIVALFVGLAAFGLAIFNFYYLRSKVDRGGREDTWAGIQQRVAELVEAQNKEVYEWVEANYYPDVSLKPRLDEIDRQLGQTTNWDYVDQTAQDYLAKANAHTDQTAATLRTEMTNAALNPAPSAVSPAIERKLERAILIQQDVVACLKLFYGLAAGDASAEVAGQIERIEARLAKSQQQQRALEDAVVKATRVANEAENKLYPKAPTDDEYEAYCAEVGATSRADKRAAEEKYEKDVRPPRARAAQEQYDKAMNKVEEAEKALAEFTPEVNVSGLEAQLAELRAQQAAFQEFEDLFLALERKIDQSITIHPPLRQSVNPPADPSATPPASPPAIDPNDPLSLDYLKQQVAPRPPVQEPAQEEAVQQSAEEHTQHLWPPPQSPAQAEPEPEDEPEPPAAYQRHNSVQMAERAEVRARKRPPLLPKRQGN